MNVSTVAGVCAGLIFAVSACWYVVDVAKKKVTVSIATFFMFSIINVSQLASLVSEGVWSVVPFSSVGLISSILILVFSIRNKKIYFKLLDQVGLGGAIIGYIAWQITNDPALNLYIINLTNFVVFVPLIVKTFRFPQLETKIPWRLNLLASATLLLTINSTMAVVWVVPARQFMASLLLNIGLSQNGKKG